MTWSWDAFNELGSEVIVEVTYDMGMFRGSVSWVKNTEDVGVALGFDEAQDDTDFDAFMSELLSLAGEHSRECGE